MIITDRDNNTDIMDAYNIKPKPVLVILSGPSGVGKDVTIKRMKELGYPFYFVVTATTRPKRPTEVEGQDYFFVSMHEFAQMIEANELLEYAIVYGDYRGVPKKQIRKALASDQDVIMRVDVQGTETLRRLVPEAIFIYMSAESEEALVKRLRERDTEPEDQLAIRIATARQEQKRLDLFDYLVINQDQCVDKTCNTIASIIQAHKCLINQPEIMI